MKYYVTNSMSISYYLKWLKISPFKGIYDKGNPKQLPRKRYALYGPKNGLKSKNSACCKVTD